MTLRCMRSTLLLALLLTTCQSFAASVSVTDHSGRTVQLAQPAQRIVALAPHIVENVFSAGAGHKLVGVVAYSDYPPQANAIERVGNFQSWSLEKVISLQPDLVLLWGSGNSISALHSLEQLGIPVYISEPRKIADIAASIRAFGELAGTETISSAEADRLQSAFTALAGQAQRAQPLTVFYQIWNEPLQTINGEHMISQVIELCGGRNVFADVAALAPKINVESVLARNPQVIVASGMDKARPEWLDDWRRYPSLTAVKEDRLVFVPPDYLQRPTARLLTGAQSLCDKLDKKP
jgi:iron complex transport system substrate-binding protein